MDCGAYIGDTAEQLVRIQSCIPQNLSRSRRTHRISTGLRSGLGPSMLPVASRIRALNIAVGAKRGKLRFQAGGGDGATAGIRWQCRGGVHSD